MEYGATPKKGIAARVEKVRHNGRTFKIIGYGTKVGNIHGWYDYNSVMSFFHLYFEPVQTVLAFPNTENFTNKLDKGIWSRYQHPGMPEIVFAPQNDEPEAVQDQYPGRGKSSNRRGRGPNRGYQGYQRYQGRGNNFRGSSGRYGRY